MPEVLGSILGSHDMHFLSGKHFDDSFYDFQLSKAQEKFGDNI